MDYGGARGNHLKGKASGSKQKRVEFRPQVSIVNPYHGSGSIPDSDTYLKEIEHGSTQNQDSSDTLSSSSATSSSDDFFQVDPRILPKFRVQSKPPLSNVGTKSLFKNEEFDVSSEAFYRLEESINESPESTSQFSDVTHESLLPYFSPTLSPPIQVMERPGGFDPNRIPASVFSKSSTPTEWSVASNDSLFSIRIGNSSFSRDHISRIDVDLPKSGELPKSEELFKSEELCQSGEPSGELYKSSELYQSREHIKANDLKTSGEPIRFRPTSPTTKGIQLDNFLDIEKTISENVNPEETRMVDEPINDGPKASVKFQVDTVIREPRDFSTPNRHPDISETRVQPFPLPIKKKTSCPLCHCPDCYQSCCSCKWICWPSFSFKWFSWPSCSTNCFNRCCKWPSCHCKCPSLSSCCCKCPNLSSCCSSWPSCKCSSWSCCKCSSWSCCKCSSWSCCKCSSWSCCKCSSWSCCKCSSWSCCKCSSWPSFKCQCSHCTWACCYCWNREQKKSCYDSSVILTDGGITNSKSSTKASSKRKWCSLFSCSSSCSCCSCCSCACCC